MKINVGCGSAKLEGYINVDIDADKKPDIVAPASHLTFCGDGMADEIRMDAVYEHLYYIERKRALAEWMRCLKPGGKLIINWLPDVEVAIRLFLSSAEGPDDTFPAWNLEMLERVTCGARWAQGEKPYQLHKGLHTKATLMEDLTGAGFIVEFLDDVTYPGTRGIPFNICAVARKP